MKNLKSRYANYDERAKYWINLIIDYYNKTYGTISTEQIVSLDMLADNFKLYFMAMDSIDRDGFTTYDQQKRPQRNPAIQIYQGALALILKLLGVCGLTIQAQVKFSGKSSDDFDTGDNFIDNLVS